ncbi:MAG: S1C family serine protease [Pirellulales bacterium]
MKITSRLCRAAWPLALGTILLGAAVATAQDGPAPGDGPRPGNPPPPGGPPPHGPQDGGPGYREHMRAIVRRLEPTFLFRMSVTPVSRALNAQLKLNGEGLVVNRVSEDGPAAKAGIQADDILLAANDKPLKDPADLEKLANDKETAGKEIKLKVLRAGETLELSVTPQKPPEGDTFIKFDTEGVINIDVREVRDIERTIREKLKSAGADLRLQFIEPGTMLPPGLKLMVQRRTDLPDDLSINIRKQGKEPADIEVKKGDQTWTVKENDLAPLPDEVRGHVEGFLGQRPPHVTLQDGPFHPPVPPPHDGPGGPPRPDGPRPPHGPGGPDGPPDGHADRGFDEFGPPQERARFPGSLERRLEDMSRRMQEMHDQLNDLRHRLRDDEGPRPPRGRRPERPDRPDGPGPDGPRPDGPGPDERPVPDES